MAGCDSERVRIGLAEARKREALLAATEKAFTAIQRAVERRHQPLRGATKSR